MTSTQVVEFWRGIMLLFPAIASWLLLVVNHMSSHGYEKFVHLVLKGAILCIVWVIIGFVLIPVR